ncbi:MAG: hypothetical protein UX02_C0002G0207 [Candidatus Moranbacteria bacterium GW2011_GWC1_45_18]|nr:MAG: hypothetical protein UT79_C0001G0254 [Candidatus Moranbacteria bacterium GW2011_GWC2_40_12]KKT32184.1 MAG: hypothetical protein UW19_C0029G0006 [Candidatus Moranbacteria bacterium GW2011_GWF2_44_10]KKT72231.1 MAG: hypothetical protein UW66_C0009G0003 [Candidatus Moranbacteria bacterium GW2011_GWF1_44_4]KKT99888.1 MAG: hypothetical protein UX02_C0002G0207 [Candidatus Moranbacteria bacterium GW2011_GWC1_45_18]OGI24565.1 MAG: hypothetical protein A2194_03420 [Candidatus Moranbacteria bacte
MRKFILYFLLVFLFAAVATFSYGFLNGEKIRSFAGQVSQIQAKHNLALQIEKIEASFRNNSKKEISQIRDESKQFSAELEAIINEAEAAKKEVASLNAPRMAEDTKELAENYYSKLAWEATDLKGIIDYKNQIFEVSAVFGEVEENVSLDEMKNIIAQARETGSKVNVDVLPQSLQLEAQALKESMNSFLIKIEDVAAMKTENMSDLDAAHEDFAAKEGQYFAAEKKYIFGMENLDTIENMIFSDLERLSRVKFSIK